MMVAQNKTEKSTLKGWNNLIIFLSRWYHLVYYIYHRMGRIWRIFRFPQV